ncbi:MAG: baseplate protein, partial [bacterium]
MKLIDLLSKTPKYSETVPSTKKKIWFRPFLVKDENILLMVQETGKEKEILMYIKELIESCFEIEDAGEMPIFDLEYLFLKLRSKSVGEIVE